MAITNQAFAWLVFEFSYVPMATLSVIHQPFVIDCAIDLAWTEPDHLRMGELGAILGLMIVT